MTGKGMRAWTGSSAATASRFRKQRPPAQELAAEIIRRAAVANGSGYVVNGLICISTQCWKALVSDVARSNETPCPAARFPTEYTWGGRDALRSAQTQSQMGRLCELDPHSGVRELR
jgi:hypothetical protein